MIFCDDGSSDETYHIINSFAEAAPITLLQHKINRGLGETIRDLIEAAVEMTNKDDIIVRLESDDTHEPQFITDMIAKVREGNDVVIASRFQPGGSQSGVVGHRALISRCANLFMKTFLIFSQS